MRLTLTQKTALRKLIHGGGTANVRKVTADALIRLRLATAINLPQPTVGRLLAITAEGRAWYKK